MLAPRITGIDIRKENFRAVCSFRPRRRAVDVVVPERDTPGSIDSI